MNVVCDKNVLAAALSLAQRAVALKSPLPNLKGILLETYENGLILSGTDLEFGITCQVETKVIEHGSIVLPAKLLTEFVRKLPDGLIAIQSDSENPLKIHINCDPIKFEVSGYAAEEFPKLPGVKEDAEKIKIKEGLLREMLTQTEVAMAREDTRPVLTGLLLEIEEGKIKFISTDGHRLAFRQAATDQKQQVKAIIPGRAVQELIKILESDMEKEVTIHADNSNIIFDMDGLTLSSRLVEGKYPPYQQIIPTNFKTTAVVNTEAFASALERAEILVRDGGNNLVKLNFNEEGIKLLAFSQDIGTIEDFVSAGVEGEAVEIRFNVRLLLDCFRNILDKEVYIDLTGEFSPCMIRPVGEHNYLYLVLPIRLN